MKWLSSRGGLFWRVYLLGVLFLASSLFFVLIALISAPSRPDESLLTDDQLLSLSNNIDNPAALLLILRSLDQEGIEASIYRPDGSRLEETATHPVSMFSLSSRTELLKKGWIPSPGFIQPLVRNQKSLGYVVSRRALALREPYNRYTLSLSRLVWVLFAVLFILSVAIIPVARAVTGPLELLTEKVRALGEGDLSVRSGIRRKDEVGELARAFDDMAERLGHVVRNEKELVANISHELRTPMARMRLALEIAELDSASMDQDQVAAMQRDLAELEHLVEEILTSSRLESGSKSTRGLPPLQKSIVQAGAILNDAVVRFRASHSERILATEIPERLPALYADPDLLRRVVDNLLDNAQKYSDLQEPIRLLAKVVPSGIQIEVRDRGIGIAAADLERLFTPFFRTDRSRARGTGGIGLGLALAKKIIEAHHGQMTVESMAGLGTVVRFFLPRFEGESAA